MSNLKCLKHPNYRGETAPILSCKMCCTLYIQVMKCLHIKRNEEGKLQGTVDRRWGSLQDFMTSIHGE